MQGLREGISDRPRYCLMHCLTLSEPYLAFGWMDIDIHQLRIDIHGNHKCGLPIPMQYILVAGSNGMQ